MENVSPSCVFWCISVVQALRERCSPMRTSRAKSRWITRTVSCWDRTVLISELSRSVHDKLAASWNHCALPFAIPIVWVLSELPLFKGLEPDSRYSNGHFRLGSTSGNSFRAPYSFSASGNGSISCCFYLQCAWKALQTGSQKADFMGLPGREQAWSVHSKQ